MHLTTLTFLRTGERKFDLRYLNLYNLLSILSLEQVFYCWHTFADIRLIFLELCKSDMWICIFHVNKVI